MPKAYFEPENLAALAKVFAEIKTRLNSQDVNDPTKLDLIAHRILNLAAEGLPPWLILQEIASQVGLIVLYPVHGGIDAATREAADRQGVAKSSSPLRPGGSRS